MQFLSNRPPPDVSPAAALQQWQQCQQSRHISSPSRSSSFQQSHEPSPLALAAIDTPRHAGQALFPISDHSRTTTPSAHSAGNSAMNRRPRDFETRAEPMVDVVTQGLITYEEALVYFRVFFEGCVSHPPLDEGSSLPDFRINTSQYLTPTSTVSILSELEVLSCLTPYAPLDVELNMASSPDPASLNPQLC